MKSGSRRTILVLLLVVVICLSASDASRRRRRRRSFEKGTGVQVIGTIEFDEHHDRHDYGGLDYTNHLFKKRFIDYEKSDSSDEHDKHQPIYSEDASDSY